MIQVVQKANTITPVHEMEPDTGVCCSVWCFRSHFCSLFLQFSGHFQHFYNEDGHKCHWLREVNVGTAAQGAHSSSNSRGSPCCPALVSSLEARRGGEGRVKEGRRGQGEGGAGKGAGAIKGNPSHGKLPLPAAPRARGVHENLLDPRHLSAQKGPAGLGDQARRQLPAGTQMGRGEASSRLCTRTS